jgi:hypothetical protein
VRFSGGYIDADADADADIQQASQDTADVNAIQLYMPAAYSQPQVAVSGEYTDVNASVPQASQYTADVNATQLYTPSAYSQPHIAVSGEYTNVNASVSQASQFTADVNATPLYMSGAYYWPFAESSGGYMDTDAHVHQASRHTANMNTPPLYMSGAYSQPSAGYSSSSSSPSTSHQSLLLEDDQDPHDRASNYAFGSPKYMTFVISDRPYADLDHAIMDRDVIETASVMRAVVFNKQASSGIKRLMAYSAHNKLLTHKGITKFLMSLALAANFCRIGAPGLERNLHFHCMTDVLSPMIHKSVIGGPLLANYRTPGSIMVERLLAKFLEVSDKPREALNVVDRDLYDVLSLVFPTPTLPVPDRSYLRIEKGYSARALAILFGNNTWNATVRFFKIDCNLALYLKGIH